MKNDAIFPSQKVLKKTVAKLQSLEVKLTEITHSISMFKMGTRRNKEERMAKRYMGTIGVTENIWNGFVN